MGIREWTRGAWAGVAGVVAVLTVVVGIAVAVNADEDDADTGSAPQPTDDTSLGAPEPSATTTDRPQPPPEIDYRPAARRAAQGGIAPFVPDGRSWVVTAADYRDGSWRLVIADGVSEVHVVQTAGGDPGALVARHLDDPRRGEPVDLARWQLGEWGSWSATGRHALTRAFTHGVVAVTAQFSPLAITRSAV